mmetsp:Transcript_72683/g.144076  ORF Transcript_72683/g.144076 Transcript_72683/m.144076 type:complete len:685 (+) Transcript_72683:16-2070(+)
MSPTESEWTTAGENFDEGAPDAASNDTGGPLRKNSAGSLRSRVREVRGAKAPTSRHLTEQIDSPEEELLSEDSWDSHLGGAETSAAAAEAEAAATTGIAPLISRKMARGGRGRRRSEAGMAACTYTPVALPSEADVIRAVASLYDDELKPYSRILRKRLAEQSGANAKDCEAVRLRAHCNSFQTLRVVSEDGGEWSALLVDREPTFVNIYDGVDIYPEEMWAAAEAYFRNLGRQGNHRLPGGRYASAQALMGRDLPFLAGCTLGRVCHFMQVALTNRRILGYADGAVVPFNCSALMVRSVRARQQLPHKGSAPARDAKDAPHAYASWEVARQKLREILESARLRGDEQVPLSNVKRLFRSLHQIELSETALGHYKLTDLLQDARFHDICTVRLRDRGYVVIPASPQKDKVSGPCPPGRRVETSETMRRPPVLRTFIHFGLPPPSPGSSSSRRSRSLPGRPSSDISDSPVRQCHSGGSLTSATHLSYAQVNRTGTPRTHPVLASASAAEPPPETAAASAPAAAEALAPQRFPITSHDAPLTIHPSSYLPWSTVAWMSSWATPHYPLLSSVPYESYLSNAGNVDFTNPHLHASTGLQVDHLADMQLWHEELCMAQKETPPSETPYRATFCPDEPLCLEDAEISGTEGTSWASPAPCPAWTPSPQYSCARDCRNPSEVDVPRTACVM